jgi:hypothetical protein
MNLNEEVYQFVESVWKTTVENRLMERLKDAALGIYLNYQRHKNHKMQKTALTEAILLADDARGLLKLAVQLQHIAYDDYKKWDDDVHKIVKRLITEKTITFGMGDRGADRGDRGANSRFGDNKDRDRPNNRSGDRDRTDRNPGDRPAPRFNDRADDRGGDRDRPKREAYKPSK